MIPANFEVITIRYLKEEDHAAYVALEKDAAVKLYVSGPSPKTEQELFSDLRRYQPSTEVLAIVETISNQFIGRCGLLPIRNSSESEIYCLLAESHWGKGIGEIVFSFLARLASHQGKTAVGVVHPENKRSLALLKKLGWVAIGTLSEPGKQQGHLRYVERNV
jgi:RimJ/RimL family protein N-acetyltransferase